MHIKRADLAWIAVGDIKEAKRFFGEVLGLELRAEAQEYGWLEFVPKEGGCALGVGQCNQEYNEVKPGNNAILTFTVDDIMSAKVELARNNVTILGDIVEVPGHVKMLFFTDRDGNKFQLVQVLS